MMANVPCQNQFLGSRISLVSKSEIRYEGILYALDLTDATISLAKVRSFGTEDRPTERPIPARDDVYEYIIFRGADIKVIDIVEPPKQASNQGGSGIIPADPAIVDYSHSGSGNGHYGNNFEGGQGRPNNNLLNNLFKGRNGPPMQNGGGGGGNYGRRNGGYTNDAGVQAGRSNQNRMMGMGQNGGGGNGNGNGRQQFVHRNNFMGYGMNYRQGGYNNQRDNGGQFQQRGGRMTTPNRVGNFGQRQGGRQGGGPRTPFRARGMNQAAFPPKVAFDGDYDFEKANEELLSTLAKAKLEDESTEKKEENGENGGEENTENKDNDKESPIFYKKDDFFDNISCESLERSKGNVPRVDWKAERKLNAETFGMNINNGNMNNRNNMMRINNQRRGPRIPRDMMMMNMMPRNGPGGNRMMMMHNNSGYFRI
ncbi:unnamed protein product [Orchesella dallaii]|uniref:Uncharacterized protein n=1 Tax=Orchesella dallaii TaxID=48710 RepID=A0ABP1RKG2_9HEXA